MRKIFLCFLIFLLSSCGQADTSFQGYVEGEYVYIATSRAGRLQKLFVSRGEDVKAGAKLFDLESDSELYVLEQASRQMDEAESRLKDMESGKRPEEIAMARAQLNQAQAEAQNAAQQLARDEKLRKSGGVSQKQLENTIANAKATAARVIELQRQIDVFNLPERKEQIKAQEAAVRSAQAKVAQAQWDLDQKSVQAPVTGLVYDTLYRPGEWVPAGNPVVQILPPANIKIRFFVPETFLSSIHNGETISVEMDGHSKKITAVITYISPSAEYTPPVIYSNETRSKLVFMVEARPDKNVAPSLHPGQPVSVILQ